MKQKKYDVFISYRRSDSSERAHLIREILKSKGYDEDRIFLDTHNIHEGEFPEIIRTALTNSKAFILLISKDSIAQTDKNVKSGSPTTDYYYEEIKQALALKLKFVPVLFDNIKIENLDFPEEIKKQRIFLKQSIDYNPETFDDKLESFLQEKKTWRDFFAIPLIILTIYTIVTLLSGICMFIYDNNFLSLDTQIEIVAQNTYTDEGIYYYQLPNEVVTYDIKKDSICHMELGGVPAVITAKFNMEQVYSIGFWSVAVGLAYEITKSKVKPHGGKAYITYIAIGVAIIAGVGLGCTLKRVYFPVQYSTSISKNLEDKIFWEKVIRKKHSSRTTQFDR